MFFTQKNNYCPKIFSPIVSLSENILTECENSREKLHRKFVISKVTISHTESNAEGKFARRNFTTTVVLTMSVFVQLVM